MLLLPKLHHSCGIVDLIGLTISTRFALHLNPAYQSGNKLKQNHFITEILFKSPIHFGKKK